MFDDVLLHCDGCRGVDRAVDYGGEMADEIGARLHLLYPIQTDGAEEYRATHKAEGECDTAAPDDQIVARLDRLGVEFEKHVARGRPRDAIPQFCSDNQIDVVVMGAYERTGFTRLFLDNPCEKVIEATDVPVLAVDLAEESIRDLTDYVCWNCRNGFETTADDVGNVQCPYCGSDALNLQRAE